MTLFDIELDREPQEETGLTDRPTDRPTDRGALPV